MEQTKPSIKICQADALEFLSQIDSANMVYIDPPFGHGAFGGFDLENLCKIVCRSYELIGLKGIVYLHGDPQMFFELGGKLPPLRGCIAWRNGWISGFKSRSTRFWPRQYQLIAGFAGKDWRWRRIERPKPENYERRGGGGGGGFVYSDWWDDIEPVDQCSFSKEKVGFLTQKPIRLMKRLLLGSTRPEDLVVDPMLGSGTMAVACQQTFRKFLGCDSDATAVEIALKRISNG